MQIKGDMYLLIFEILSSIELAHPIELINDNSNTECINIAYRKFERRVRLSIALVANLDRQIIVVEKRLFFLFLCKNKYRTV